jgi:SHS2 domain-containing protein
VPQLRYRALAHTADLRMLVWGEDERRLIANAVAGAINLALGRPPHVAVERWAPIAPWPGEPAHRLVAAINEALYQLYTHHEVAVDFRLRGERGSLGLADLPARLRPQVEVKAATFHALNVERRRGRLRAVLTLDV